MAEQIIIALEKMVPGLILLSYKTCYHLEMKVFISDLAKQQSC